MNGTSGSPDHYGEGGHTEVSHRAATAPEVDPNAVDIGDGARGAGGGQATESVFCCWPRPQPKAGEDGAITVSKPADVKDQAFAELSPSHVLIEGYLNKAGKIPNGQFKERWIKITPEYIHYSVLDTSSAIDQIFFRDIAGVAFDGISDEPELATYFRMQPEFEWERDHAVDLKLKPEEFVLCTTRTGYHSGRQFLFSCSSQMERERWSESVARILQMHLHRPIPPMSTLSKIRRKVRWAYIGDRCQVLLACLIMINFVINICEAHFNGKKTDVLIAVFEKFNLAFTIIFTVELVVNMFATLFLEFVSDAWNWFDFTVVLVSLLSLGMEDLPGAQVLRLMRCFRVFRLFKRIPSLRQIIVALYSSIPPMANAFALVCLVTAIYAIMAVTFFSDKNDEEFGDFFKAMFTMFQVMTGDAWSDIARGLFVGDANDAMVALFFVSFQLIVALVLVNVVIAVLLDEFSKAADKRVIVSIAGQDSGENDPLERLVRDLAVFKDSHDMDERIKEVFVKIVDGALSQNEMAKLKPTMSLGCKTELEEPKKTVVTERRKWASRSMSFLCIQVEGNLAGAVLSYSQLREGLKKLEYIPPIFIVKKNWDELFVNKGFCNEKQQIGLKGFTFMIRDVCRRYQTSELHISMKDCSGSDGWNNQSVRSVVMGIKGLLVEEDAAYTRDTSQLLAATKAKATVVQSGDGIVSSVPPASDDQVRVLLKKLVGEVNLLQKRLDSFEGRGGTLECDLAASSNNNLEEPKRSSGNEGRISNSPAKSRGSPLESVKKLQQVKPADKSPTGTLSASVPGVNGPVPASSLPSSARSHNVNNSGLSASFLKRKANDRRKELAQISAREGSQASHRGPQQDEFIGQGWNFFQSTFLDKAAPAGVNKEQNDILGGFFGGVTEGLGAIGNTVLGSPTAEAPK